MKISGTRHNLGPDKAQAETEFYQLMLNPEDTGSFTRFDLMEEFLDWTKAHRTSGKEDRSMVCQQRHRASNKGFLRMSLDKYLELLDWTGRQIRGDKRGSIPASLAPILERLQISRESWVDCIQNFGRWFGWAVGKENALVNERD